jgi:photosystem II stability/assembly factor-like uncharacterized protein
MLGAAHAGSRIVAVGERGIILLSDDNGKRWQQADVPVSVTLTAVRFADARNGVAVGHAGVVLTTSDGGAHWQRVLDGHSWPPSPCKPPRLPPARTPHPAQALPRRRTPRRRWRGQAAAGRLPAAANRILAVGAYGLAFASEDGGRTWSWMDRISNPKGLHLNTVRANGRHHPDRGSAATPNSPPTPAAASTR